MLSNFQIEKIAKDLKLKLPLENILMKNELTKPKVNYNYIINLQSSYQGSGSHWTGLIVEQHESFYFDSFGVEPSYEVIQFCKKMKPKHHLFYNNWIIQDLDSDLCGWYCIGLILYVSKLRKKYISLHECCNDYVNMFKDETKDNAQVLKSFFKPYRIHYKNILMDND